ncbi:hypothetical protein COU20_00630 [Candidatus Kaiserbacteria bacterium CG10_big_fil_rev_8_21_14_0_10_59_10]|uniref:Uncharacterized protein n=1 Tax=Candidatus Kaiserbacteria bacterium CG10_big_fil_rev_8_21_14_0_10_59_10 TaxID=1974612 RepID=A0A2H0U8T7_9BACT|nr:MAG: hypothetical protein COU20_00630 [Candidatus Kaiserbacteria bacterium CG10_big_fil_rev_8_21_14_0_10_59_10]
MTSSSLLRACTAAGVGALVFLALPLVLAAQEDRSEELHASIRAAILADPRSADMSDEEIAILVNALAAEAEAQGVVHEYLPDPGPVFLEGEAVQPSAAGRIGGVLVLLILGLAVVVLGWYVLRRLGRGEEGTISDTPDAPPSATAPTV